MLRLFFLRCIKKKNSIFCVIFILCSLISASVAAQEANSQANADVAQASQSLSVDATIIKGNTELPKFLYVVPWQEKRSNASSSTQKVVIHNIYGDLFDPVLPEPIIMDPINDIKK